MNSCGAETPAVPAHRVVNRNGLLTGKHHFSTPTLMEELLQAEGIAVANDKVIEFKSCFGIRQRATKNEPCKKIKRR